MPRRDFLRSKQHNEVFEKCHVLHETGAAVLVGLVAGYMMQIFYGRAASFSYETRQTGALEHGFGFFFLWEWEWNGIIPIFPNWRIYIYILFFFQRGTVGIPPLQEMFSYILLPMVIFAAGFNLDKHRFFRFGGYIAALGITGTVAWSV